MEEGGKQFRNEYDRFLLKFLVKNYYVSRVELSKAIGLSPSYVREFDNGTRSFGNEALDRLEEMITAKYELVLSKHEYALEQARATILSIRTDEELQNFRNRIDEMLEL
ncbi:hypothetical protein [Enterococcus termitis]|uniref:HTH cro/C1-type domain-containing protein n=1 Tax=Enterococcus termitis TaxID=332950 RepID=A0A1E5H146_9ENTE|nr:hypothetical protein [Enterococcus termitis]OEG18718.1 hypothetical protein BCR25_16085 [Enterococcus termitis]OJG97559.1 hypothetical protein RV18_GL000627 [Enterococcus termitis]